MAINYTQAFNAGEVSRKIDGRSDLEIYKSGCRDLDNFFVLPQGGVERRAGTEFVQYAGTDGTNPARMIEFDFSSDVFFVIEIGTSYAKVHYTDDNGEDQAINVTNGTVPAYTEAELRTLQFNRRYDTLILTCPTKETQVFKRETIAPTFSIAPITYTYPPTMEKNITNNEISFSSITGDIYSGEVTLTSTDDLFFEGHVGSHWGIDHIRDADKKEISYTKNSGTATSYSEVLDASFVNWAFETDDTWNGELIIERSIAGGAFTNYVVIGDTSTGVSRNFKYASQTPEGANTELRIKYTRNTGTLKASLESDNNYHKGVVKIKTYTSATEVTADIVSLIQGGNRDSSDNPQTPTATIHWSEGAFSEYRGFSPASEFFENRLWLAGSKDEPADLFGSVFGEIFNFLSGELSTDAIKRTIDSPEEPKWLEGKRYLFLGTAGTAVSIRSADTDSLITQSNITTLVENAYGSAALQAEVANDVVVYVQRDGLKVRELVFDQGQDTFVGNDLNLISEDITDSGVVEMFVQKEPNQYIWCIKENGDACVMTYERGQDVKGWARVNTDGKFFSAAAIHDSGEDIVWACIERNGKYCIEKFHLRRDLNWYVDSGKKFQTTGNKSGSFLNDLSNDNDFAIINITDHGYSTGDVVSIESSTYSDLTGNNYEVERIDANNFYLRIIGTTIKIPVKEFVVSGTARVDGNYILDRGFGNLNDLNTRYTKEGTTPGYGFIGFTPSERYISLRWLITQPTPESTSDFAGVGVDFVWNVNWGSGSEMAGGSFASGSNRAITVKQISNKVTNLSHLEGKTVQVLVDNNYVADKVVTSGEVSVDEYGTEVIAGLPYVSTLRPMPIEPNLVNKLSQSRVKATSKIIVRFFKTKGAAVGEQGKQLTTYSVLDTQDSLGEMLEVKTGQQRFFVASDYEREKVIEVRQNLPYPMTVLSIATHINAEGA